MQRRLQVEEYFRTSGRTLRKGHFRLWFDEEVKPRLMRAGFQAAGLYESGRRNAVSPRVHFVRIAIPGLPRALEGFTILQISDLHIDKMDGLAEAVATLCTPLRPDVCVLTGDYRYEIRGSCAEVYPRMDVVLASLHPRLGTFGILGNHDAAEIAEYLDGRGVHMLLNSATKVIVEDAEIWLAGVDDPYDYRCADISRALESVPEQAFTVLLAHTPEVYCEAAARGIKLYLCGHTHAGQIRLPGVGALKVNGRFPREFAQGHWVYNAMHAYTSWGAGCSTVPVRFHCPAEVALIELGPV